MALIVTPRGWSDPPATPFSSRLSRIGRRWLAVSLLGLLCACSSPTERVFMNQCTVNDTAGNDDACACAYDRITSHYPDGYLDKLSESSQVPEDFPDVVLEAGAFCKNKYPNG